MSEYIERGALLLRIDCHGTNKFGMLDEDIRAFIKKQPAADVVEVKHGKWVDKWGGRYVNQCYRCSVCGDHALGNDKRWFLTDYCPNCGAKMDGE